MLKPFYKRLFLTMSIVIIGAGGALFAQAHSPKTPTQPVNITPIDVITTTAQMENVPEVINSIGHMRATQSVNLSFDVAGHITKILAQNGHRVNKGQVIAELDDQSDEAQLRSLQADADLATNTYNRTLKLQQYGGVSVQELDQNHAKMLAAQAAVEEQQDLIAKKQLIAPFSGVLGDFQFSVGAYVGPGSNVVSLVQEAPLLAEFSIPADERARLEIGQTVDVTNGAYPGKVFHGILNYISPNVDPTTGTLLLEAQVENDDYLLLPGMFVRIIQVLHAHRELLMIPDIALLTDIQGQYVYRVSGNSVEKVYVKVGQIIKDRAEIRHGLSPDDVIVVAGQQKLAPGDTIHVIDTQMMTGS